MPDGTEILHRDFFNLYFYSGAMARTLNSVPVKTVAVACGLAIESGDFEPIRKGEGVLFRGKEIPGVFSCRPHDERNFLLHIDCNIIDTNIPI